MGLYDEAVDLALKVDINLATVYANKPEEDEELRKKLWLRIARHVVEEERDIKKAMEFLNTCDLLKIEDILPFFPDFVLIDDFKEAICNSLQEYNKHIEELQIDMDEATKSADIVRQDIQQLRNKYGIVGANQKCDLCGYLALTRQFYLFPCNHVFHADCLTKETMQYLNILQKQQVQDLQFKIQQEAATARKESASTDELNVIVPQFEQLKQKLDEIIAAECIYCGEAIIKTIDQPFPIEEASGLGFLI